MQNRYPRPTSVRVIGYILLTYALFGAWSFIHGNLKTAPGGDDPIVKSYAAVAPLLYGISGFFILRGAHWARMLFWFSCFPIVLVAFIAQGSLVINLGLIFPCLPALFLLTRDSNRFFLGRDTLSKPPPEDAIRKTNSDHRSGRYDY